jgi:hypothetical protein
VLAATPFSFSISLGAPVSAVRGLLAHRLSIPRSDVVVCTVPERSTKHTSLRQLAASACASARSRRAAAEGGTDRACYACLPIMPSPGHHPRSTQFPSAAEHGHEVRIGGSVAARTQVGNTTHHARKHALRDWCATGSGCTRPGTDRVYSHARIGTATAGVAARRTRGSQQPTLSHNICWDGSPVARRRPAHRCDVVYMACSSARVRHPPPRGVNQVGCV